MRITEQIDALRIMGINSASYLILPKFSRRFYFPPFPCGTEHVSWHSWWLCDGALRPVPTEYEYVFGIPGLFEPPETLLSFTKVIVSAYIITSVSSYYGYYTSGGALEVGPQQVPTRLFIAASLFCYLRSLLPICSSTVDRDPQHKQNLWRPPVVKDVSFTFERGKPI